jgi:putative DNA primase/helicase
MLCHIASGKHSWMDQKVKNGSIVYLAGEGHHGLKGRIAAWMQHHNTQNMSMWISKAGCDLNTSEGYQIVAESIRGMEIKPAAIAVDTLHRFLHGDENSAQDAKTMIDACARLMAEFGCAVILVHHTGVSEEAQHRARGSSAWKGALEIEISVQPRKDNQITLIQRKAKDAELAEPLWLELQSVEIPGWKDDDGDPVTSAVVATGTPPAKGRHASHSEWLQTMRTAWERGGKELHDSNPYVTASVLREVMTEEGASKDSIKKALQESAGRMIGKLVEAGTITPVKNGWAVIEGEVLSTWTMGKK